MTGALTPYEAKIVKKVAEYGCFVVSAFDPKESEPPFSYSIGFVAMLGQPEVTMVGLPSETAHNLINDLYSLAKNGLRLVDGAAINDLVADYQCIAREVDESWLVQSQFASALWYHRTQLERPLTDILQIVWPDAEGYFPWEDGCAQWVRDDQTPLYEPRLAA